MHYTRTTPLHLAAQRDCPKMIQCLLEHDANLHVKDKEGCTPLHLAAIRGHIETVELLLQQGADMRMLPIIETVLRFIMHK